MQAALYFSWRTVVGRRSVSALAFPLPAFLPLPALGALLFGRPQREALLFLHARGFLDRLFALFSFRTLLSIRSLLGLKPFALGRFNRLKARPLSSGGRLFTRPLARGLLFKPLLTHRLEPGLTLGFMVDGLLSCYGRSRLEFFKEGFLSGCRGGLALGECRLFRLHSNFWLKDFLKARRARLLTCPAEIRP